MKFSLKFYLMLIFWQGKITGMKMKAAMRHSKTILEKISLFQDFLSMKKMVINGVMFQVPI